VLAASIGHGLPGSGAHQGQAARLDPPHFPAEGL
jgi:hypothetical protein